MNNLTFPEGITYKYKYTTSGDFIPTGHNAGVSMAYAYFARENRIIEILYDTSNVTNMSYMFNGCVNLNSISQLDTSNVTNMNNMFYNCSGLTSIPQLDTSKVTTMSNMLESCKNLPTIPQLDTSNVTSMDSMFRYCSILTTIPQLDCSKVTSIGMFGYGGNTSIVNLGGFKNLGMQKSVSNTSGNYFLYASSKLTHESIMNVINNLYDRKSAGYSVLTLKLHANTLTLLSDEEKAIATNKGWTLATS